MTSEVTFQLGYKFDGSTIGLCFNPVAFGMDGIYGRNMSYGDQRKYYAEKIEYNLNLYQIMNELSSYLISRVSNVDDQFEIDTFFKWCACLYINYRNYKKLESLCTDQCYEYTVD